MSGERRNRFSGVVKESKAEPIQPTQPVQTVATPTPKVKPDRKKGRTHPDIKDNYVSTTVYIARAVHKPIKAALLDDGRDLSELVEDLLRDWLETGKPGSSES